MPAETPASAATWRRLTASRPRSAATRIRASAIRARRARWSTLFGTRPVFHNAVALTPVEAHRYIAVVLKNAAGASPRRTDRRPPEATMPAPPALPFDRPRPIDPPPAYAELRRTSPVARVLTPEGAPAWLVTSYD